jgi:hypothetical protein
MSLGQVVGPQDFAEVRNSNPKPCRPKQNDRSPSFTFGNLNNADDIMKENFLELVLLLYSE